MAQASVAWEAEPQRHLLENNVAVLEGDRAGVRAHDQCERRNIRRLRPGRHADALEVGEEVHRGVSRVQTGPILPR